MLGSGEGADVPDSLINSFALVAYLPEPLAGCVETLRREVHTDEDGDVRGHVTILPPRPLACLAWSSAPRHLGPRDRFIGWTAQQRRAGIHLLAYNTRFLYWRPCC